MLFTKREKVKEVLSSRMLHAPERVDALEVMIATMGEVEERGIVKRLRLLVASTLKSCQDVATQLNRERLKAGGGIANGAGKWQGTMDRERLMRHGHIVERGLLQALRSELGELLVAGRKAFELTKDGRLRLSAWRSNYAWARVHAEHPRVGELGARSIVPEEALKAVSASARRSAQLGLEAVQAAVAAKGGTGGGGRDVPRRRLSKPQPRLRQVESGVELYLDCVQTVLSSPWDEWPMAVQIGYPNHRLAKETRLVSSVGRALVER